MASQKPIKLTAYRVVVLTEAATADGSLTPSGYRMAGPDAARWWNAIEHLVSIGFATRNANHARATETGRAWLASREQA